MSLGSLRSRASAGVLALFLALALPASALASATLSGVTGVQTVTQTTVTQTTATTAPPITIPTTSTGGGIGTLAAIAIGVVAVVLFVTIVYVIRRDAHAHEPRHAIRDIDRQRGTVPPRAERVKRSRAKAKAARRARKSGR
jgi:hypothetical protein